MLLHEATLKKKTSEILIGNIRLFIITTEVSKAYSEKIEQGLALEPKGSFSSL